MKKWITLVCAAAMMLALTGCGAEKNAVKAIPTRAEAVTMSASPAAGQYGTTGAKTPESNAASQQETIQTSANGYTVEVLSASKDKDYLGNDIIMVRYRFTNSNSSSAAFWQATNQAVSQNGKSLSPDGIVCDDTEFMNSYAQVSNGQSIICAYPYPYYGTDDLSIKVSIYNYASGTTAASASGSIAVH